MGKNLVQKILDAHLVSGEPRTGAEVGIRIDQTLTQDATGTMAYLQFEALGFSRVKTDLSVSYIDHNTIQEGFENADDHRYLRSVAAKFGVKFSRAGNGICHQVHLERFGVPGATLLGSDSHTTTGGGMGMIAIGAGGLDVAVAMGGGPLYLTYPRVMKIELRGRLRPWVSAKDVILEVLRVLSTKGNVGWMLEYGGGGAETLSVPERATIANMGAETGVTASVFPSDEQTRAFLRAQGREESFRPLAAEADAAYDRTTVIDLDALEPLAACPHSPGNVRPVRELAGTRVDQVLIGSCTNSSLRDLMIVAAALDGKRSAPSVSLGVAPGSRQVLRMIAENGALAAMIASGARILESACGFCIGNSLAPPSGGVSLRTINRNFEGRSGTADAGVYLVSPETAVASALTGAITDPRLHFGEGTFPDIRIPERFTVDDSMIEEPSPRPEEVEIVRGPNIGAPPHSDALPSAIDGVVGICLGDKVTTDHIMPAGNRLKYRSNIPKYAEFVFERIDPGFAGRALADSRNGLQTIVVAGESYGQGSSREHAAICPMYLGVRMVIAKSIERIHKANLVNFGIVPALFEDPGDYDALRAGDRLRIDDIRGAVREGAARVRNVTRDAVFSVRMEISERERGIVLAGGLINATKTGA